jgi:DNA-nicking Smr family endonuclease
VKKKEHISVSEKKIWEDYVNNPKGIFDKEKKNSDLNFKKKRFKFDLHGFTLDQANKKTKEIIISSFKESYSEILLITGKGSHSNTKNNIYVSEHLSKLKFSIPDFIKSDQEVFNKILSISEADIKDGGSGALIIKLKKSL